MRRPAELDDRDRQEVAEAPNEPKDFRDDQSVVVSLFFLFVQDAKWHPRAFWLGWTLAGMFYLVMFLVTR